MVTYAHTKVTYMSVVFTARDSVDILKFIETVANFVFITSVKKSHFKSP